MELCRRAVGCRAVEVWRYGGMGVWRRDVGVATRDTRRCGALEACCGHGDVEV